MYKWSLLLLASFAVFQPIASFTERNLIDGRQQCCDHQPHLLQRDARLSVYGNYRPSKAAPEDRRLNDQRDVLATRRYEVRSVETALARERESPDFRRVLTERSTRISRFDRRAVGIDTRDQLSRHASRDRFSRVSSQEDRVYRGSQIRFSRDVRARVAPSSMYSRRDQRLPTRETTNMRDNRAFSEGRETHRTRNDVVQANSPSRQITREAEFFNRRNYVDQSESRRQNVRDNNKENRYWERRVRDVSQSRLPLARSSRALEENRRMTSDNRMRKLDLNRRVVRESFTERKVREIPESRHDTDSGRVRVLNQRDQTREDFRQERRVTSTDRRFERTVEREVRLRIRPESTERSEEMQSRKIRENTREYQNNDRDARRSTVDRRLVISVDRPLNRDAAIERRQLARSNMATATRRSSLSRDESRSNIVRNDMRRVQNSRNDMREMRETERRSVDHQMRREDRRFTPTNNEIRSASVDRVMSRRRSYDAEINHQSRNMERRIHSLAESNRRSNSRNHEQERQGNRRTSERRMERSRHESRSTDVRPDRQAQRFDSRVDARNQRSARFDERSNNVLTRQTRVLEKDASRTRDARINHVRIENTREVRNREVKSHVAAEVRERGDARSRLGLAEAAMSRREFMTKSLEQESFALNWQFLFYTLQGIYLCGIIATIINEKPDSHKSRSWWGIATKAVKVD